MSHEIFCLYKILKILKIVQNKKIPIGIFLFNNLKQFFKTSFSLHSLQNTIFAHQHQISFSSDFNNFFWARTISDTCADFVSKIHHFIHTDSPLITSHSAMFTSFRAIECIIILAISESRNSDISHHIFNNIYFAWVSFIRLTTMRTNPSNKPLSNDYIEPRC